MSMLWILACFSALLQASLSTPISASKPKPVFLSYTCMVVADPQYADSNQEDAPIIFIHGLGGYKELWEGVSDVISLRTKRRVCAVDLRNHGNSAWNDKEYDVEAMTEDIKNYMEVYNMPRAIVVGHSLGGKIAVHLALNYPELVEGIIVEDNRPNGESPETMKILEFYAHLYIELEKRIPQGVTEREAKEQVAPFVNEYLLKMNLTFEDKELKYIPIKCSNGKCRLSTNPVVFDTILRNTYIDGFLNESSGTFYGPALFIYGTKSALKVGEDESNIKKLFPNAKLVPVQGSDHTVHQHKEFITEVVNFIKSI